MRSPSILRAMFMVYANFMKQYSYKFLVLFICLGMMVIDPDLQSVLVKVQPSATYRYYRT